MKAWFFIQCSTKKDNSVCSFKSLDGKTKFGRVKKFAECAPLGTVVFIAPFNAKRRSILKMTRAPCQTLLNACTDMGLISMQIYCGSTIFTMHFHCLCPTTKCYRKMCFRCSKAYIIRFPDTHESQRSNQLSLNVPYFLFVCFCVTITLLYIIIFQLLYNKIDYFPSIILLKQK